MFDGRTNLGLTDTDAIAEQFAQWAACGVPTRTYGLGRFGEPDEVPA